VEMVSMHVHSTRLMRILLAVTTAFRARRLRTDLYHLHNPEMIPAGLLLKFVFRKRVIYDTQEDFPAMMLTKMYLPRQTQPLVSNIVRLAERLAARSFDGFIAADSGTLRAVARTGKSKKLVFYNLPNLAVFPEPVAKQKSFDFVYRGGLSERAGTFVLLEALRLLVRRGLSARLLLFGYADSGQARSLIERRVHEFALDAHVVLRGRIDHSEMAATLSQAKVAISPLLSIPKFLHNIPVKVFESWACGLPVISSDLPPIRPFFRNKEYGFLVPPGNAEELAGAMEYFVRNPLHAERMGMAGRKAVVERYNNGREIRKLLSFYSHILGRAPEKNVVTHLDPRIEKAS
jgi:glycosyltransferase involved in cell wall biosynthesis